MISSLFIMDAKGKVLIWRDYRGDVPLRIAERFITLVLASDDVDAKPIFEEEGHNFLYVKHQNVYRKHFFGRAKTLDPTFLPLSSDGHR